jgi:hypothetical protein
MGFDDDDDVLEQWYGGASTATLSHVSCRTCSTCSPAQGWARGLAQCGRGCATSYPLDPLDAPCWRPFLQP